MQSPDPNNNKKIAINLKPTKFLIAMKCEAVAKDWDKSYVPILLPQTPPVPPESPTTDKK